MISGIIVVNPELTEQDLVSLRTQLSLSEIITGREFDERLLFDPTYHRQVYMLNRRVLVIRPDIHSCDRKNVDFILSVRNGLVSIDFVRYDHYDPYAQHHDGYDGYHDDGYCRAEPRAHFMVKSEPAMKPHVLVQDGPKENPFIDHWYEGPPPYGPFRREMIEQWDWDHHIVRNYPWQSAYQQGGSALNPFGNSGISEREKYRSGQTYPLERITLGTLYYHKKLTLGGNVGPPPGSAAQFHDPYIPWWKKGPLP